jgi:hypothetical protein
MSAVVSYVGGSFDVGLITVGGHVIGLANVRIPAELANRPVGKQRRLVGILARSSAMLLIHAPSLGHVFTK